jgi:hypothetical protein
VRTGLVDEQFTEPERLDHLSRQSLVRLLVLLVICHIKLV